ncbi:hypothetical protein [Barnesiella viscericola]
MHRLPFFWTPHRVRGDPVLRRGIQEIPAAALVPCGPSLDPASGAG